MEALEQLKPIREESRQQHSSQIAPPKELTDLSRESNLGNVVVRPPSMFMLGSPDKGPMHHASKAQATKPQESGQKRTRQIFKGARLSQVNIPQ